MFSCAKFVPSLIVALALVACGGMRGCFREFSLARCGLVVQMPGEPTEEIDAALNITRYTTRVGNRSSNGMATLGATLKGAQR